MKIFKCGECGAETLKKELKEIKIILDDGTEHIEALEFFCEADIENFSFENLLKQNYDLIEISQNLETDFLNHEKFLELNLHYTQYFDALLFQNNKYNPLQLNPKILSLILSNQKTYLDIQKAAVLVGEEAFLLSFAAQMVQIGYKNVILIHVNNIDMKDKIKKMSSILFDVHIEQIQIDDLGNLREPASCLCLDLDFQKYPDITETISYFNFLIPNSFYLNLRDFINPVLYQEAEKALLKVCNSYEFAIKKYQYVYKKLNIRS